MQRYRSVSGTLCIIYFLFSISPDLLSSSVGSALALWGGRSVTPQSKNANFFLSARKLGFKEVVWGLMLRKKSSGGENQIPSP